MTLIRPLSPMLAAVAVALAAALPAGAVEFSRKAQGADTLLTADEAFQLLAVRRDGDGVRVSWLIAPGYYLYRHRLAAEAVDGGAALAPLQLPAGLPKHDEHFGDVEIYVTAVDGRLPLAAGSAAPKRLKLRWQGCAEAGVCYPPVTRTVDVAP